jgi:hypothetical protein
MERSMGALTVLPPSWVHVSVPSSRDWQPITSSVYSALPKMVTRSYGGSPTLGSNVSKARRINDWMYSQSLWIDSLWVSEGVLELEGERGPGDELLHVPGEGAVET